MTKQDLKEFRLMQKEIEMLDREIREMDYDVVSDTVKGSSKDFPYMEHTVTITGLDERGHADKVRRLQRRLERRKADLQDKRLEMLAFIDTLDTSLDRQMITLRYVDGLSWEQVAASMGSGYTVNSIKKANERFLRKMKVVTNVTKKGSKV